MNATAMNNLRWLLKREFWEHRGGFLRTPIIAGAIFLVLNVMGIITAEVFGARSGIQIGTGGGLRHVIARMDAGDLSNVGRALDIAMFSASALLATIAGFVVFFYCLGSLYDDRRDRSILFWKSLPVSDGMTVLSKVLSAALVAPVIALVAGIIAGVLQLLLVAVTLSFHGVGIWHLLGYAHPFGMLSRFVLLLPVYVLWALPTIGWLMLCSAFARTKPFLWAVALPVGAGLVVGWLDVMSPFHQMSAWFWQNIVQRCLLGVFPSLGNLVGLDAASYLRRDGNGIGFDPLDAFGTWHLLAAPSLWIGAVVGVGLLLAATWFRRWRDDA